MILHWHHIIPKHMGGTDHPSNMIQLTLEDHAIAHKILYGLYGKWEDRIAWLALSGQITNAEANREASRLGNLGRKWSDEINKKKANVGKFNGMYGVHLIGEENGFYGKKHKEETKEILKNKSKGNKNILGRVYITDGIKSRMIYPTQEIPEGWRLGRTFNYVKRAA